MTKPNQPKELEKLDDEKDGFNLIEFFDIIRTQGIDVEREDRSVGIFGNNFILGFNCKHRQIQLSFFDNEFDEFLDKVEPYIEERKAMKEMDNQMMKDMEKDKK